MTSPTSWALLRTYCLFTAVGVDALAAATIAARGLRVEEVAPNNGIQRPAHCAAADAGRYATETVTQMRVIQLVGITLLMTALMACAAVGVPATSDPAKKLDLAWDLINRQVRPFPAEVLIREAMEIYQRQNDEIGLSRAFYVYGVFFRMPSSHGQYRFLDKSATYETRFEKSIEYFEKARELDEKHALYSRLSTVYLEMGMTYVRMGRRESACTAFRKSLESHQRYTKANPGAPRPVPAGFATWEDFVAGMRKRTNCE